VLVTVVTFNQRKESAVPRKRKPTEQPVTVATSEPTPPAPVTPPEPDVFDAAIAERQAAQVVPPVEREKPIDPRRQANIALTEDANNGPKMYLWRNNAGREMAITFDEKPDAQHLQTLKDAGFRWQGEKKAWTKPMDMERKWATHLDAERCFFKVGNDIRQEQGLEPVQGVAV
jgi:hypothetical protein